MVTVKKQSDFYELLGIPRQSGMDEIRRAFYSLLRMHPSLTDPEGYQRIRLAFDTLGDARARRHYDALWGFTPEIKDLAERAVASMLDFNCLGASRYLKEILVHENGADEARNLLGVCQRELGLLEEALNTYTTLVERRPEIPLYWLRCGDLFFEKAQKSSEDDKKPLIGSARFHYRKAMKIDPVSALPYIAIAKTYIDEKKLGQALTWVSKPVDAIKQIDFHHLDLCAFMFHIYALTNDPKRLIALTKRIERLLPDDDDIKKYAASMMGVTALELVEYKLFEAARYLLNTAARLDKFSPGLKELQDKVDLIVGAEAIWKELEDNDAIIQPVKALAVLLYAQFSGHKVESNFGSTAKSIRAKISSSRPGQVTESIQLLKDKYPQFYRIDPEMWDDLLQKARRASGQATTYTSSSSAGKPKSTSSAYVAPDSGPGSGVKDPVRLAKPQAEGIKDWSIYAGAASAIILGILGYFLIPSQWSVVGAIGCVALGYYVGSAIGRLL